MLLKVIENNNKKKNEPATVVATATTTKNNNDSKKCKKEEEETKYGRLHEKVRSWDDRIAMQSQFTLKEKGYHVEVEWKTNEHGTGIYAAQFIPKGTLIRRCVLGDTLFTFRNKDDVNKFVATDPNDLNEEEEEEEEVLPETETETETDEEDSDYTYDSDTSSSSSTPTLKTQGNKTMKQKQEQVKEAADPAKVRYVQDYFFGLNFINSSSSSLENRNEREPDVVAIMVPGMGCNHSSDDQSNFDFYGVLLQQDGEEHDNDIDDHQPSCHYDMVASKDIPPGTELTADYNKFGLAPRWIQDWSNEHDLKLVFSNCNDYVN